MSTATSPGEAGGPAVDDGVGRVEQHGVDAIPEAERTATPRNLFWVMVGGNMTFGIILFGWLPIAAGLGWWSTVTAITVGLLIGIAILAPMALLGTRTGTNGAVTSAAAFGVSGRLIGSAITLFIAIGFTALTVWTGGDAVVSGASRLLGLPATDLTHALGYAVISVVIAAVGVYGYATVLALQRWVAVIVVGLLIVGFITLGGKFDAGYSGGEYALGSFWPTWFLGVVIAASLPVSYAPFINDYSRYVSRRRWSQRSIMLGTGVGAFCGLWFGMVFAAFAASTFADKATPFVPGLIDTSPTWYVALIVLVGLLGSLSQGAMATYSTGLNLTAVLPMISRTLATPVVSLVVVGLVFLGTFVWNAVDTVNAFVSLMVIVTTPWAVINLIAYVRCRGEYDIEGLQGFLSGERGGMYWFSGGWNLRAVIAWGIGSGIGLLFASTTLYVGPWANAARGVDLSFASSAVVGGVVYVVALRLFPERRHAPAVPPVVPEARA